MKRALVLLMDEAAGLVIGSDQSVHVLSGRAELAERVRKASLLPAGVCPRHVNWPQRATVEASCTGDSYEPAVPVPSVMRSSLPIVPVATRSRPCGDASRRVASPSFVWASKV